MTHLDTKGKAEDIAMSDNTWFLLIAAGPVLLGCAIAYALMRHRQLTPREEQRQHESLQDLYHERK